MEEVAFCGHATLATAYGVGGEISFSTRRVGTLKVRSHAGGYTLDLPTLAPEPLEPIPMLLCELFPRGWRGVFRNFENLFVELASEAELRAYVPDSSYIVSLHPLGLCVTAPGIAGSTFDFLSTSTSQTKRLQRARDNEPRSAPGVGLRPG